jgi:hypothetical protein
MRGETDTVEGIVYVLIRQAIVSNFLYSTVAASLARSFKRNMSEKYSQLIKILTTSFWVYTAKTGSVTSLTSPLWFLLWAPCIQTFVGSGSFLGHVSAHKHCVVR